MLKTLLAAMLILLQGVSALPGRLHLCFEANGALCCIDGGDHQCDCGHGCAADHHDEPGCGQQADCRCEDHSSEREANPLANGTHESGHRHILIAVSEQDSTHRRGNGIEIEAASAVCDFALVAPVIDFELNDRRLVCIHGFDSEAAPFSLLARASTVLRC